MPSRRSIVPLQQSFGTAGRALVRVNGEPAQAMSIIHDAVRAVDPDLPIENMRTLDDLRERSLATPKLTAMLLTVFAGLALLVTITGITGVIAQSVSQRTQEFGLRMALGATQQSVLRMVIRQGLILVGLGLAIGIGAALALSRVLQTYLYQTTPTDPLTFVVVATAFVVAGTLACLGPAWRATTVDPMLALRGGLRLALHGAAETAGHSGIAAAGFDRASARWRFRTSAAFTPLLRSYVLDAQRPNAREQRADTTAIQASLLCASRVSAAPEREPTACPPDPVLRSSPSTDRASS